jgi:hypothetical protein
MKQQTQTESRPVTLAEICEAIASGKIPAEIEDGYYTVSHRALRQLRPAPDRAVVLTMPVRRPANLAS